MTRRFWPALLVLATTLVGCSLPGTRESAGVETVGAYRWAATHPKFGGLSGLEISDDGSRMLALSDRGTLWDGAVARDDQGRITGIATTGPFVLRGTDGKPLPPRTVDSEGLALGADGRIRVSFEGEARVLAYDRPGGPATALPTPTAFSDFGRNSSLEALAVAPDGALWTLPEAFGTADFPLWRFAGGTWAQPCQVSRSGGFRPVGADFGPDGRFYLLERAFAGYGFRSRIRRFELAQCHGTQAGEVLFATGLNDYFNFEGIAAWRDAGGAIRLTLIADNNFTRFLHTDLLELRVRD